VDAGSETDEKIQKLTVLDRRGGEYLRGKKKLVHWKRGSFQQASQNQNGQNFKFGRKKKKSNQGGESLWIGGGQGEAMEKNGVLEKVQFSERSGA